MSVALVKILWVIGITVSVSLFVALLVNLLTSLTARIERASAVPEAKVCPVDLGIPNEDVAAVSAAVYALIGPHRLTHIGMGAHGRSWINEGRVAHHRSHSVPHAPRRVGGERHKEES